jgi:hypothetical protein
MESTYTSPVPLGKAREPEAREKRTRFGASMERGNTRKTKKKRETKREKRREKKTRKNKWKRTRKKKREKSNKILLLNTNFTSHWEY